MSALRHSSCSAFVGCFVEAAGGGPVGVGSFGCAGAVTGSEKKHATAMTPRIVAPRPATKLEGNFMIDLP
jgi:hypothetical protein